MNSDTAKLLEQASRKYILNSSLPYTEDSEEFPHSAPTAILNMAFLNHFWKSWSAELGFIHSAVKLNLICSANTFHSLSFSPLDTAWMTIRIDEFPTVSFRDGEWVDGEDFCDAILHMEFHDFKKVIAVRFCAKLDFSY